MTLVNPAQQAAPRPAGEFSLLDIFNTILRNWRIVVLLPLLFALLVGAWSLARDRMFAASASFAPQAGETRGGGEAMALAQRFGVNLGGNSSGQSPQFYIDMLRSQRLLRAAVQTEYRVPTDEGTVWEGTLIEYWHFQDRKGVVPPWRHATSRLGENMSASVSRETGIVRLVVSADNPFLAEQVATRVLELLNDFNLHVRQARAQEEGRFVGARVTEVRAELAAAEAALLTFLQQNRNFENSPELAFEHDRLQRQVSMRQEVYTSLLRSQEQARIDAVRDVPLFTVIDRPEDSVLPRSRGTVVAVLLAFILGLLLAIFLAFVREAARRSRESKDPQYGEFRSLARQAWSDFRYPSRWLRR